MLVESVGSALIVGKLRKGKFSNLLNIDIKRAEVIVAAVVIQSIAAIIVARELTPWWQAINNNGIWIQLIVFALLFFGAASNLHIKGMPVIMIGLVLNFLVIMANGGKMPVSIDGIEHIVSRENIEILMSGRSFKHTIASESTRLLFLGDIIHFKRPYPLPKSVSLGDIFIMVGIFFLIQASMVNKVYRTFKKIHH